jgi:hypothetical protein
MLRHVTLVRTDVSEEQYVPPKRRFLQEPHSVTSQKTAFFKSQKQIYFKSTSAVW